MTLFLTTKLVMSTGNKEFEDNAWNIDRQFAYQRQIHHHCIIIIIIAVITTITTNV